MNIGRVPRLLSVRLLARLHSQSSVHTPIATKAVDAHPPFARYAHGCVVPPHARLIACSGQLGITKDGAIPDGAEAQLSRQWTDGASEMRTTRHVAAGEPLCFSYLG